MWSFTLSSLMILPLTMSSTTALLQPSNTDATCFQKRTSPDAPGSAIVSGLELGSAVGGACGFSGKHSTTRVGSQDVVSYQSGSLFLNISSSTLYEDPLPVSPNYCPDTFNSIVRKCLANGTYWGGWIEQGGSNYSITDSIYPANPLGPASQQSTSMSKTSSSSHASPAPTVRVSSTATSSQSTTTKPPPLTVIKSYSADITSTIFPGISINTHTSTGDSSHPSAIVPILASCWFCPPGGGGFLLWGFSAPGIYPPPPNPPVPNWPTITIGNDLDPTPDPSENPSAKKTASQPSKSAGSQPSPNASTGADGGSQACKREIEDHTGKKGKRGEQMVASTDPLKSALLNLQDPSYLDPANTPNIKLITNKALGQRAAKAAGLPAPRSNFFVTGLTGHLVIPPGKTLVIGGQKMTSPMPWTIRWDYDPDKLSHVNAEFGKGENNPTFAYTFSTGGGSTYGETYMRDALQLLTQVARLDIAASVDQPQPVFMQGTDLAEATQNIISEWKKILEAPCPASGQDVQNSGNPNLPP